MENPSPPAPSSKPSPQQPASSHLVGSVAATTAAVTATATANATAAAAAAAALPLAGGTREEFLKSLLREAEIEDEEFHTCFEALRKSGVKESNFRSLGKTSEDEILRKLARYGVQLEVGPLDRLVSLIQGRYGTALPAAPHSTPATQPSTATDSAGRVAVEPERPRTPTKEQPSSSPHTPNTAFRKDVNAKLDAMAQMIARNPGFSTQGIVTPSSYIKEVKNNNGWIAARPSWTPIKLADGKEDPWKEHLPPNAKEAETVQLHVTKVIEGLPRDTMCCLVDAHDRVSFSDRKPDIVVLPTSVAATPSPLPDRQHLQRATAKQALEKIRTSKPSLPSPFYYAGLGEVKGRRLDAEFTDQELGDLVSFLLALLQACPERVKVVGFITDSYWIQFVEVHVDSQQPKAVSFRPSPVMALTSEGGDYLRGFLELPPVELGAPPSIIQIHGNEVKIIAPLGSGSSSTVWRGEWRQKTGKEVEVVVKVFRGDFVGHLDLEKSNLDIVKELPGVTRLIAAPIDIADTKNVLLLGPVGTTFSLNSNLPCAEHLCALVDILYQVHTTVKYVHRDINWTNIFVDTSGQLFLNDWASAVPIDHRSTFYGALQFASDAVLRNVHAQHTATPADDLEMVVKLAYAMSVRHYAHPRFPAIEVRDGRASQEQATRLADAWRLVFQTQRAWNDFLKAARSVDYNDLKDHIKKLVPTGTAASSRELPVGPSAHP